MTDAAPSHKPSGRPEAVRTRFCPSPSGDLHVGNIRTALYAWAYARASGGRFVFRIEDTDQTRVTEESIESAARALHWLGLEWDEGIGIGGDFGPYRQSERLHVYRDQAARFLAEGRAYACYCTPEELEAEREEQRAKGLPPGYSGHCRTLTRERIAAYESEGRRPVTRFRIPEGQTVVHDTIRGPITFDHANIPDFVLMRANGYPLYNLAVAVDDALMRITHVLRGDDLLTSTPRQIQIYRAMGVADADLPTFTHLPYVLDPDGKPMSKRYGSASISWYRDNGYLPEAVVNYLALLGWSPGDDREDFTLAELVELFDVERVGSNAARLDPKKLDSINGDKIRALDPDDFVRRMVPFLGQAGLLESTGEPLAGEPPAGQLPAGELPAAEPDDEAVALVRKAAPLVQERLTRLSDAPELLGFLLVPDAEFRIEPEAAARVLTEDSRVVLEAAEEALADVRPWQVPEIERALRATLIDDLGRKPKHAFAPVRVAVTGRRVSPPLFESLELLGRDRTLARLHAALHESVGA